VPAGDEQVAALVGRFPALARYGRFRAAATPNLVRLEALGWRQRVFVAIGFEDDLPSAVATRSRFSNQWRQVPEAEWPAVLGN